MAIKEKDLPNSIDIIMQPELYGYEQCKSCNGFGGDNRREDGVPHELCEDCGGDGVNPKIEEGSVKIEAKNKDDETMVIFDESGFGSGAGIK